MLPSRAFYMIRHGQSEANLNGITAGGGLDSPLTALGKTQAQNLSEFIDSLENKPARLFSSPMVRAYETARLLNDSLRLQHEVVPALHEMHFGDWEGTPWEKIAPSLEKGEQAPNGESREVFSSRVQRTISTTLGQCRDDEIPMIVAHGGLFYAIGMLYGHEITSVHNCHLHLFEPCTKTACFPWKVWQYDIKDTMLVKNTAPFCSTRLGLTNIKKAS